MTPEKLIDEALSVTGEFMLSGKHLSAGSVGCAILSSSGRVFTGICIDLACGIGFCAEHSAIAEMLKSRETKIEMIVAVTKNIGGKSILPPCGRCREMMFQINRENAGAVVILGDNKHVTLGELLPEAWIP